MNLKTRLFGDISVGDDKVVYFENGIIGFSNIKEICDCGMMLRNQMHNCLASIS